MENSTTPITIHLIGEETPREVKINTGSLYRFEKAGGNLTKVSEAPISTMIDLIIHSIKTKNEDIEELIEKMPDLGIVAEAFQAAMKYSGFDKIGDSVQGE